MQKTHNFRLVSFKSTLLSDTYQQKKKVIPLKKTLRKVELMPSTSGSMIVTLGTRTIEKNLK